MPAPHRPEQAPKNHFDVMNLLMNGLVRALELGAEQERQLLSSEEEKGRLHYEATHDSLTGALNSHGLNELLTTSNPPRAMLYVDGTNQKAVNDKLGHDRGDEAIVETAKILRDSLRSNDVLARIGGDEFLVLLDTSRRENEDPLSSGELLVPVIERIGQKTKEFLGDQGNVDLRGAGFDIAVGGAILQEGMPIADLRSAAEQNMYQDKNKQHLANGQYR
jgi:diguanylate cyclase (GGDEF)-like protein